jgi:hypothetical protein
MTPSCNLLETWGGECDRQRSAALAALGAAGKWDPGSWTWIPEGVDWIPGVGSISAGCRLRRAVIKCSFPDAMLAYLKAK